jgi:hypothetical protein
MIPCNATFKLSRNVQQCPEMSRNVQQCPAMSSNVQQCPVMSRQVGVALNGLIVYHFPNSFISVYYRQRRMVFDEFIYVLKIIRSIYVYIQVYNVFVTMSRNVQTCPEMSRHVQTCPDMSRHVQTCPDMSRHVQTCPDLSRHVQTCPNTN